MLILGFGKGLEKDNCSNLSIKLLVASRKLSHYSSSARTIPSILLLTISSAYLVPAQGITALLLYTIHVKIKFQTRKGNFLNNYKDLLALDTSPRTFTKTKHFSPESINLSGCRNLSHEMSGEARDDFDAALATDKSAFRRTFHLKIDLENLSPRQGQSRSELLTIVKGGHVGFTEQRMIYFVPSGQKRSSGIEIHQNVLSAEVPPGGNDDGYKSELRHM